MFYFIFVYLTIDNFFDDNKITDSHSQMGQNFNFLYQNMQMFLNDLNGIFKSTNDTIIIPLETYKSKLIKSYNTLLKEFEELISRYKTCKNDLLKAQSKYYNSCMDVSKEKDTNSDIYMKRMFY